MKSKSELLLKNTFIYTIGNFGSKLLSFLLVPLYSFYLTKSSLGYYDLILTTMSLVVPFITLQIADATYRWLIDDQGEENRKRLAISNGIVILFFNSLVFCLIYFIANFFLHLQYPAYIYLIILSGCLMPFLMQTVRGIGQNKLYSMSGIFNTVFILLFNLLFLAISKMTLGTLLLSMILANTLTIIGVVLISGIHRFFDLRLISRKEIRSMIQYSWPLIPNTISWWLINEVNRFIILYNMGAGANGIFAISNKFPSIIIIVNSIFMLSWQDHAMTTLQDKDKEAVNSKIFNTYMVLEFTMVILLTAVSRILVKNFIGEAYYEAWKYMPMLYLSVAFSSFSGFFGVAYLGAKKTTSIFTTSIFGSLVNVAFTFLLIKQIGLFAPAAGTALGFFTIYQVRLIQTKKFFPIKINYQLFTFLLALSLLFIWLAFIENLYIEVFSIIAAAVIAVVFNRDLFEYLFNFSKKLYLRPKTAA